MKRAMAGADEGHLKPGGSQQVPGGGQEMPEHLTIGTKKAFERNYAFPYQKEKDRFGDNLCVL